MKTDPADVTGADEDTKQRAVHSAEGSAGGALAGAALGALAGPPGIAAGAVLGAIAGAMAGAALSKDAAQKQAEDEQLDREIGVTDGDIGAPNLEHPPAVTGAFSAASVGAGGASEGAGDDEVADGPIDPPPSG